MEESEQGDLDELKSLLEQNRRSIQALRSMIEEMESLLTALSQSNAVQDEDTITGKGPEGP